jgi:hypothetical protein
METARTRTAALTGIYARLIGSVSIRRMLLSAVAMIPRSLFRLSACDHTRKVLPPVIASSQTASHR